jgi:ribosomal protein S13
MDRNDAAKLLDTKNWRTAARRGSDRRVRGQETDRNVVGRKMKICFLMKSAGIPQETVIRMEQWLNDWQ